jgi:CRISPR/Cas system-associated exonuclease Cas4 (RecB family)
VASPRTQTHAPWSASKVHAALKCPRLFHYRYVEKIAEPEVMVEARIGKAVHATLERVLAGIQLSIAKDEGAGELSTEEELGKFEVLCARIPAFLGRIDQFRRSRRVGRQLIEAQLAVRAEFTPASFYAGDAYFRGIVDLAYFYGDGNLALVDHKTGVRRPNIDVAEQLEGYAVLAAATFRSMRKLWLGIHWVGLGEIEWAPPLSRAEVNQRLLPRVQSTIEAAALAVLEGPRTNPGPWCEFCSYRSVCPVGREIRFEPCDEAEPDPGVD